MKRFGLAVVSLLVAFSAFADIHGVKGGLVVCVGAEALEGLSNDWKNEHFVFQCLEISPEKISSLRKKIQQAGCYGKVSVNTFDGKTLPYADNLVNLLVADSGKWQVASGEIARALAPRGVALVKNSLATCPSSLTTQSSAGIKGWTKLVKQVPPEIDEWTHYLHDAGNNPVARDRISGPPRRLQWTADPRWARSHGWAPSVSAMVSAGGRIFYLCDETLTGVDMTVPDKWFLSARDAFSGTLLWKIPVAHWGTKYQNGLPGTGKPASNGRFTMPPNINRRLVAIGDTVYLTPGARAPVTAYDAATGKTKRVYQETAFANEFIYDDGRLIVSIDPPEMPVDFMPEKGESPPPAPGKHICAIDAASGKLLWKKGPFTGVRATKGQDPFGRLELSAGEGKVFFLTPDTIDCLAAGTGKELWTIRRAELPETAVRRIGFAGMYEYLLTVMLYNDGVVLLAQPEPDSPHTYHTVPGTLYAFDAKTGKQLWKHGYGGWGHCTPPDVFVVNATVWTHVNADAEFGGKAGGGGKNVKDTSKVDYRIQALDLRTGKLLREIPTREIFNVGHHHRCYRNKITERYLMSSRRGVEYVDLASGENQQNHWVRSGCLLGNLPCNGLLYVAPHPCGCYIEAKLTGFNALAPAPKARQEAGSREQGARLVKGPAYGAIGNQKSAIGNASWPTYRHDPERSGYTAAKLSSKLKKAWSTNIGTKPSGLTAAGGKVFAAGVDAHTVHALDAATGKQAWDYTAGARVDSPPTIYNGMAVFGSADGHVYSLRAADGALAWKFAAAPEERFVMVRDRLESAWPVPGSVLIKDGACWFAAGRSSYLDGGIHIYAIDPATGKVLQQKTVWSINPKTGKMDPDTSPKDLPGLLNDIPVTDGENVFIRQMDVISGETGSRQLYSTGGFLDSSWFNRTHWQKEKVSSSGVMAAGPEFAHSVDVYGSRSRESVFTPGANAYRLRCDWLKPPPVKKTAAKTQQKKKKKKKSKGKPAVWEQRPPIRIVSIVRAADTVFVAGSPDVVDPADPHGAWEGRKGGVLAAFDAADGKKLAEYKLDTPPVWDGMAIADGKLYIAGMDGSVTCMQQE